MTFDKTKSALINAIKLPKTPVIALHGLWGTGKTYLWRKTASELEAAEDISSLYVSCMAYGTIASLKSAVISTLLSRTSGLAKHGDQAFKFIAGYLNKRFLPEELHISTSLSDFQVFLPQIKTILPKNTILVLDDIERATELDMRELLGFVSFIVDQLDIRILLIVNKERLGEKQKDWEQMREKVVSIEVSLQASPSDCLEIAFTGIRQEHFVIFSDQIRRLEITNIRTLQHMRRTYEALSEVGCISDDQWPSFIPSIVLFVALHFNILKNALSIDQVLESIAMRYSAPKELTDEQQSTRQFLSSYGLDPIDDFEYKILIPYLQTGFLDRDSLLRYMKDVLAEDKVNKAKNAMDEFLHQFYWGASQSTSDLAFSLNELLSLIEFLDGFSATKLARLASELGNSELSKTIIDRWIDSHRAGVFESNLDENLSDTRSLIHDMHPSIEALYRERYNQIHPPLSLRSAIERIDLHNAWGDRESYAIENASPSEMENIIRTADPEFRAQFFAFFTKYLRSQNPDGFFRKPADRFAAVCRDILTKEPESRVAWVIRRAFADMGVERELGGTTS